MKRCLEEVNRHDEETRHERIEYAEKLLQRLKTGPKQLESAYKLSNILGEQEKQRHERVKQKQLKWQKDLIEGQNLIEQAVEWIEQQKEHIRNYRKRCAQYKGILQNDIKEREQQKHKTNQWLSEIEEKEAQTNAKQMHKVLEKEQKNVTDRRVDRQNADYLSKYNIQQRRQRNVSIRILINLLFFLYWVIKKRYFAVVFPAIFFHKPF